MTVNTRHLIVMEYQTSKPSLKLLVRLQELWKGLRKKFVFDIKAIAPMRPFNRIMP